MHIIRPHLLLSAALLLIATTNAFARNVDLIFIGNSITEGALIADCHLNAPPAKCVAIMAASMPESTVRHINAGRSGATTVDFLPPDSPLFSRIIHGADSLHAAESTQMVFSIMLGTNDSAISGTTGAPVSAADYRANLTTIIDSLLTRYPTAIAVVHRPLWYSDNTHNGAIYLREGQQRLNVYYATLKSLVKDYASRMPGRVFLGDTRGYVQFQKHHKREMFAEDGKSGVFYLHPNLEGGSRLAKLWADALMHCIIAAGKQ